ncbi:MAG: hypothetical protein P1S60_14095 [Anaerolineae bacterium]|nr:hypothetical protein [Anaerolineae bacterium]
MLPKGLRTWFIVHFFVDMIFGLPLLFAPVWSLSLLGWQVVEPLTTRLVGAALMGIGIESYLGRNAAKEVYQAMLNLKLIWSASAVFALSMSIRAGAPAVTWLILRLFAFFFVVWAYYKLKMRTS